jgi:hypothetical protein
MSDDDEEAADTGRDNSKKEDSTGKRLQQISEG